MSDEALHILSETRPTMALRPYIRGKDVSIVVERDSERLRLPLLAAKLGTIDAETNLCKITLECATDNFDDGFARDRLLVGATIVVVVRVPDGTNRTWTLRGKKCKTKLALRHRQDAVTFVHKLLCEVKLTSSTAL